MTVSQKLQNLITQINEYTNDTHDNLTEAIQTLRDEQINNEWLIDSEKKLKAFSEEVNDKGRTHINAKLVCDIGSENNLIDWTNLGIGTFENPYQGIFDGQGFNIWLKFNITSDSIVNDKYGFFHYLKNATIKNLTLQGEFKANKEDTTTKPLVGLLSIYANESMFEKCFTKIKVECTNFHLNKDNGCGCINAAGEGLKIYQCGNEGNITLAQPTNATVANSTGTFSAISGKIKSYNKPTYIEECYNKGDIINSSWGGGIVTNIDGCLQDDNYIEVIFDNNHILSKEILNLTDDSPDLTEDNYIIECSENLEGFFDIFASNRGNIYFISLKSKNDIESDHERIQIYDKTTNSLLFEKNIKLVSLNSCKKTNIVKNCYNIGNCYCNAKSNISYSITAGFFGDLSNNFKTTSNFLCLNCYDTNIHDTATKKTTIYYFVIALPYIKENSILKNCYVLKHPTISLSDNFKIILNNCYSALMEHPHFCDMLDSNIFICANRYPCFKWEYDFSKHGDFSRFKEFENFYIENSLLPSHYFHSSDSIIKNKIVLNKNTEFRNEFSFDNQEKEVYIDSSANISDRAFYFNENLEKVDIINASQINIEAFKDCPNLKTLIIRKTDGVIALQEINALSEDVRVYVPGALKDNYRSDDNWILYSIFSIEGTEIQEEFDAGYITEEQYQTAIENLYNITGGFVL